MKILSRAVVLTVLIIFFKSASTQAASLTDTISKIKPSIVGIGTHLPTRAPQSQLSGTGFVVADGYHIVTNAHVVSNEINADSLEKRVVFVGTGRSPEVREARVLNVDEEHDVALLRISGRRLPALEVGDSAKVKEGQLYAFTGFPIGAILGLYPVTHQGIISSITPVVIPASSHRQLTAQAINRLRHPYFVFQIDATAYPGNSGSPLYDPANGKVVGIINKVFVKETKENALKDPSGITYAIPSKYILKLLADTGLKK